jgi:hypothetical protein
VIGADEVFQLGGACSVVGEVTDSAELRDEGIDSPFDECSNVDGGVTYGLQRRS